MANATSTISVQGGELDTLASTVVKLVQLGFLGFGALLFIMVFVLLYRNQPVDAASAKLRQQFLAFGVGAFVFAGLMQLVTLFFAPHSGAYKVSVAFSPQLSTANLPEPSMVVLPVNQPVKQYQPFTVSADETLDIGIDGIIDQAKSLNTVARQLTQANAQLATAAAAPASSPAAAAARPQILQLQSLSRQLQFHLDRGDFASAAKAATQANQVSAAAARSAGGATG